MNGDQRVITTLSNAKQDRYRAQEGRIAAASLTAGAVAESWLGGIIQGTLGRARVSSLSKHSELLCQKCSLSGG